MSDPAEIITLQPRYSIRVVSRMTAISAHTLRMWERRYGFPQPQRTEGGARRYGDEDVQRLQMITQAMELGYRPNEVVPMPADPLRELLKRQAAKAPQPVTNLGDPVEAALAAIREMDEARAGAVLQQAVAAMGARRFVTDVADPLCSQVGELWQEGELGIHQEHLLVEVLTTRLRALLAAYPTAQGRPRVLLSTLPEELHGMGIQMAALYLALSGAYPRLLGVNTPTADLVEAARGFDAQVVALSVSSNADKRKTQAHLDQLLDTLPRRTELWLGGAGATALDLGDATGVRMVHGWAKLDSAMSEWSGR